MVPALASTVASRTYRPGVAVAAASPVMSTWVTARTRVESTLLAVSFR
jgi:hypothetical protein